MPVSNMALLNTLEGYRNQSGLKCNVSTPFLMKGLQNQWTYSIQISFCCQLPVEPQLSTASFLSCLILVLSHYLFPLPVNGVDWACQYGTHASFIQVSSHEFFGKSTRMGYLPQATEEHVFDTWIYGIPTFFTQTLAFENK